jgi:polygalacturonase
MTMRGIAGAVWLACMTSAVSGGEAGKVFDVVDYGAKPDGRSLCTAAIQKAVDAASEAGGGTVRFPKGAFLSGAVRMKSGVTIRIDEGATLLGSRNREDYYGPAFDDDGRPVEGKTIFRHLIHGQGLHDIALRGKGTIDGNGNAFRDKKKKRTKCIYFENCRNITVEGLRLRAAGCWMQHYRLCRNLVIRGIDVFNHVAFNNDGMNIDSCRDVTIKHCRIDSDDDGIVLKSLSPEPCRNVTITDCVVSSHCNALKMGTESGGGFVDMTIRNCRVSSPKKSKVIYGRQRGLAGIALEIVDGGRLENVTVRDVTIEGVSVPIFLRLGNRARPYIGRTPGVGTFRKVRLTNITAKGTSPVGCSITGLPGHPIEDVVLENVRLGFDGGGTREDAGREIPEKEKSYPESTMFGTLPAYGFFVRHVRGVTFRGLTLTTEKPDLRHAMVFDDAEDVTIDGLDATCSPDAAALLRLKQVRRLALRRCAPKADVDVLLRIEGDKTEKITLRECDLARVKRPLDAADDVPESAVSLGGTE